MRNDIFFIYLLILAGSTYLIRVIPFIAIKKTDKQPLYPLFFVLYSLYSPHSDDNSCHLLRNTLVGWSSCRTYRCSPLCPQRQKPHNSGIGIMYDCIHCGILSLIDSFYDIIHS